MSSPKETASKPLPTMPAEKLLPVGKPILCSYHDGADMLGVSLNHFRGLVENGSVEAVRVGKRAVRARIASIQDLARRGV